MKTAMKLTTGILIAAITMAGAASTKAVAQSSDAIDNARSTAKALQQNDAATTGAKPLPGAPAPAIKPAVIPSSSTGKPATKTASVSSANNQLKHVNVLQGSDNVQIEITSSQSVTPKVSKLSSPARVLVELPETVVGSSQTKIPVNSEGVKGVRIGMDGKTPPTTSVVIDLEKALTYDIAPGADGKVVLTLHTQAGAQEVAKSTPAPVKNAPLKAAASPVKTAVAPVKSAPAATQPKAAAVTAAVAKPADTKSTSVKQVATKPADAKPAPAKPAAATATAAKSATPAAPAKTAAQVPAKADTKQAAKTVAPASPAEPAKPVEPTKPKPEEKHWAMSGKRDPFFSPVVQTSSSGCSTGKKCLEIGAINLRGVVKSDTGFIAVVTNSLNKAYFLRENDPVFNGYVVKITGDSVVFEETLQDKLGKPFTREVVKRIFTPAV